ncbi:Gfo/Idh/MocA family protein [Nesterenkonia haasae]|uniref:Gfo/Idh/MocA family protein n=1 Tax=Nesterenkonia haasae TaxID=2587813 RepID=UPI00192EC3A5|nr:Gfo/Idh/MocA family oxidoreductase [Nesterenkonia haasae]
MSPGAPQLRVGLVGAGNISGQYLSTLSRLDDLRLTAVADLDLTRAHEVAGAYGAQAMDVPTLISSETVDVVLNLTIPRAHADVALSAIAAGKGVYTEKPLAATVAEGRSMVDAARSAGVVIGGAPDTVLGTGVQTAREVIDSGRIGMPMSATATMIIPGHEHWHPNPDFYYQPGGGPLLDMGPYYITSLVTLLGPVVRVVGAASALRAERTIGSGPRAGEQLPVSTPSHVAGILVHQSGAISSVVMSFDGVATHARPLEIHGERGSVTVPDPNNFSGEVLLHQGEGGWQHVPVSAGYKQAARGYGLADLFWSGAFDGNLAAGRSQGELALHVLEVMEAVLSAARGSNGVEIATRPDRPSPVPLDER